jgi:peptidoglycan hydrolase-like protein with peptidoglycan-binding domain
VFKGCCERPFHLCRRGDQRPGRWHPRVESANTESRPRLALGQLECQNLAAGDYCYGSHLAVDGIYGSNTRAVVKAVQRKHKLVADGIYGPKTRSAMNWRLFRNATPQWSTGCYSPL